MIITLNSSCTEKEVKLPVIPVSGQTEIQNHSSIWIFAETENGKTEAVLNKNNKLLNTHWIYNIDSRLQMGQIIPLLDQMQANRSKPSVHKKGGMKNYFSYANSLEQKICLTPFYPVDFVLHDEFLPGHAPSFYRSEVKSYRSEVKSISAATEETCIVPVKILGSQFEIGSRQIAMDEIEALKEELKVCDTIGIASVRLIYNADLSYEDYLKARTYLESELISLDVEEHVYSLK